MNHLHSLLVPVTSLCVAGSAGGQTLIRTHEGPATGGAFGSAVAALHDVDGDGVVDYAVSDIGTSLGKTYHAGTVDVFSGVSGALLFTIPGCGSGSFGASLGDAGDVDGDGIPDLLVGDPWFDDPNQAYVGEGALRVYSGKNGALLHEFFGAWSWCSLGTYVAGLDDVDGDGVPDFLVGILLGAPWLSPAHLFGVSGRSGSKLYEVDLDQWWWPGPKMQTVGRDRDGDGYRDFVMLGGSQANLVRACSGATGATIGTVDLGICMYSTEITEAGDADGDGQPEVLVQWVHGCCADCYEPWIDVVSIPNATILRSSRGGAAVTLSDLDADGVEEYLLHMIPVGRDTWGPGLFSGRSGQRMSASLSDMFLQTSFLDRSPVDDLDGDGISDVLASGAWYVDPVLNVPRGRVEVYSNDEFWIEADPNPASPGVVESLTTGRVPASNPIGIAVVDVNGVSMFQFIAITAADPNGLLQLTGTVPPGLTGFSATFQGFALDRAGRIVTSPGATLDFN